MNKSKDTISDVGEFALIKQLTSLEANEIPAEIISIGDDAAVLPFKWLLQGGSDSSLVVTTDGLVENKDFRLSYSKPFDIGWKLLAINISDIAAMGGIPKAAVVNLQLPSNCEVEWVREVYRGLHACAAKFCVHIDGGDASGASEISLGLTLLGVINGKALLRSAAKAGDDVWVSGELGAAGIALRILEGKYAGVEKYSFEQLEAMNMRLFRPNPRVALGQMLQTKSLGSCAIDISDGLVQDLLHIVQASKVDIELDYDCLPSSLLGRDKYTALNAGEDFELLFTAPVASSSSILELETKLIEEGHKLSLTKIGKVVSTASTNSGRLFIHDQKCGKYKWNDFFAHYQLPMAPGFEHF